MALNCAGTLARVVGAVIFKVQSGSELVRLGACWKTGDSAGSPGRLMSVPCPSCTQMLTRTR